MSLLSVIFKKPKNITLGIAENVGPDVFEIMVLDVAQNITHNLSATLTQNPIESGSKLTDHMDINPTTLSYTGIVSEAPLSLLGAALGNVAGAIPAVAGVGGLAGTIFTGAAATLGGLLLNSLDDRGKEGFNTMKQIMVEKTPLTIITGLETYNNMLLTQFTPIQTAQMGNSLRFTCTFQQAIFAFSETVDLPDRIFDDANKNKGGSVLDKGKKVSGESGANAPRGESFLSKLTS